MNNYIAIETETNQIIARAATKKDLINELINDLSGVLGSGEGTGQYHIAEIIDTLTVSTKQIIESMITNSDGKEVKVDSRDRVIPTERKRTTGDLEAQAEELLEQIG